MTGNPNETNKGMLEIAYAKLNHQYEKYCAVKTRLLANDDRTAESQAAHQAGLDAVNADYEAAEQEALDALNLWPPAPVPGAAALAPAPGPAPPHGGSFKPNHAVNRSFTGRS